MINKNLRDWQKRASERRNKIATDDTFMGSITSFKAGFDSRNAEIDLLLQIIEKQSEALQKIYYLDSKTHKDGSIEL
jgi:hypothetical protein